MLHSRWITAGATIACLAAPRPATGQAAPTAAPLTLDEVLALADAANPHLRAMRARVTAAEAGEPEASTLPDPMLQLGVMNFGVPSLSTSMPTSMAPQLQLMQMVPFPGKLSLRGEIASYSTEMAGTGADEAWWQVRDRTSSVFYQLYTLDRRLEVMRETMGLLEDFRDVARAMYVAGTGRQADVLRAEVEVARIDADIRQMEATRIAAAARLNGLLDRPAATPVGSPVLSDLPAEVPQRDTLSAWARETRPLLAGGQLAVDRAAAATRLARRDIWPDLQLGFAYGQRDRGFGVERMGSAMVGVTLPVHAASRQHARRDEAVAMEADAAADLAGAEAEVEARLGELLAELDRARTLAELYRGEIIPEARATVESALSSYRVGSVDFMTLVDAQMAVNRYEGELYQLLGDYGKAVAGLESAVGRELPRSGTLLTEER